MDIGTILIWISLILAIIVPLGSFILYLTRRILLKKIIILGTLLCVLFITLAYFLLTYYFLISNFNIHYVWYNSSENVDWYLKLTGVWAGQEGSFLIWVWIILIALGIEEGIQFYRNRKKVQNIDKDGDEAGETDYNEAEEAKVLTTYDWTRAIIMLVVLIFLILLVMNDPFEPTHLHEVKTADGSKFTIDPDNYPGGHGMNPMLRNPWMVIHPPVLFIGYALITIPFAAGLGYSITGDKNWTKISLQWSRLAWLFLTLGIGIGAVWAYVALGWGGYWAWDPVEVAGLIPWITLSAFLHTQLMNKRKNEYKMITPLLGAITFLLVLFATFITRSGFWTSVHAWSESEVVMILMATMIITLILSLIIILVSFLRREDLPTFEQGQTSEEGQIEGEEDKKYNWDSLTMLTTVIIFAVLTVVTLFVLMDTMERFSPEAYETRLAPFVTILMIIMSICLCWRYFGKENSIYIIAWTALAGVACAVILPMYLFPDTAKAFYFEKMITNLNIVGFMIPFAVLLIISAIYKMFRQFKVKTMAFRNKLKINGAHLIHLGVAFIILGYLASQTMVKEETQWLQEGETLEIDEYEIKLIKIDIKLDTGDLRSNEYWDTWFITVEIYKNGEFIKRGNLNTVYGYSYNQQGNKYYSMIMTSEIFVETMVDEDLYLSFKDIESNRIKLTAKTIPLMSFLWFGMVLFVIGIVLRIGIDYLPIKKAIPRGISKPPRKGIKIPTKPTKVTLDRLKAKKKKKDYEKMLEDELKRLRS